MKLARRDLHQRDQDPRAEAPIRVDSLCVQTVDQIDDIPLAADNRARQRFFVPPERQPSQRRVEQVSRDLLDVPPWHNRRPTPFLWR